MNTKTKRKSFFFRPKVEPKLPPNRRKKVAKAKNETKATEPEQEKTIKTPHKSLRALFRIVATTVITGATLWAGVATYEHTTTSPYFAISAIAISGSDRIQRDEILKTAGFSDGVNIFLFDIELARRALQEHPWIETAKVKRKLPRTLLIDITERTSVAIAMMDVPYLVDETGEVFKRWSQGDPITAPIISGINREEFIEDPERIRAKIRDAIHLAKRYRQVGLERTAPLSEIHCEVDGGFSFATKQDSFYVRFGLGPYRDKLSRLKVLLNRLSRDGKRPAMIFFDNRVRPDRVTVKLKAPEKWNSKGIKSSMKTSTAEKSVSKI